MIKCHLPSDVGTEGNVCIGDKERHEDFGLATSFPQLDTEENSGKRKMKRTNV